MNLNGERKGIEGAGERGGRGGDREEGGRMGGITRGARNSSRETAKGGKYEK